MRKYLVLLYQKDTYHYDETGMPAGITTQKKFLPDYMWWQKAQNPDNAVAILYQEKREFFMDTDHYAAYSGWRAWVRFLTFGIFFYRYL